MPLRPCLGLPGQPCNTLTPGSRCPHHSRQAEHKRTQAKRERRPRATTQETQRRADTVQAWIDTYGYVCPGWQRDPHPSTDLTADHAIPVGSGGTEDGPLGILCRTCNGRKQSRTN